MKKIIALLIITLMFSSLVGCNEFTPTPNPEGDQPEHEQQPTPSNPKYEGYSELLQNIMANKNYNDLIDQIFIDNMSIINSGEVEPHPYAFLEEEGYDVEAIKAGNDLAYTMSYVLDEEPNNLYMYTRVLQTDHYVNYLLKYELTDEEMDDYNLLHRPDGLAHFYLQSVFMNNEISKTRKPEIVGKSKITVNAFDKLTKDIQTLAPSIKQNSCDFMLLNLNKESNSFDIVIIPRLHQDNYMTIQSQMTIINCLATLDVRNNTYYGPFSFSQIFEISHTKNNATFYFSQDADLAFIYALSLESKN